MFAAKKYLVEVGKDVKNSEEKEGQDYSGGFLFCMVIIFTKIIHLLQIILFRPRRIILPANRCAEKWDVPRR